MKVFFDRSKFKIAVISLAIMILCLCLLLFCACNNSDSTKDDGPEIEPKYTISFLNCNLSPITAYAGDEVPVGLYVPSDDYRPNKHDVFKGWRYNGKTVESITMPQKDILLVPDWKPDGWTYISTKNEFCSIFKKLSGKYMLLNDIDLGDWGQYGSAWHGDNTYFTGELDGNGHKISYQIQNIMPNNPNRNHAVGLFPLVSGARIYDIEVNANISVIGGESLSFYAGGIAGYAKSNARLNNCVVKGVINQTNIKVPFEYVCSGGIVGFSESCKFEYCKNYAEIYAFYLSKQGKGARSGGITVSRKEALSEVFYCNNYSTKIQASTYEWDNNVTNEYLTKL